MEGNMEAKMEMMKSLQGSIVAVVTPMKNDSKSVDYEALVKLVEWHIESGTQGIIAMGTTGESATVTEEEWAEIVTTCINTTNKRVPIIAGTGTNCTATALARTLKAKDLGADGALVVCPYYNKPTQEGLFQHFQAIANAAAGFPIILYNVPGRTAVDLLPKTVVRLAAVKNIIGIKDAKGDIERFSTLRKLCPPDFKIFSGEDDLACGAILEQQADGVMSVTANIEPKLMQEMCSAALDGNRQKALKINEMLLPLHKGLFCETNPTPVKFVLAEVLGRIEEGIRLPLLRLSETNREILRNDMAKLQAAKK